MTEPSLSLQASRRRLPALALWSLVLVVAPFLVFVAAGLVGRSLEGNPDSTANNAAAAVSIGSEFLIPLVWIASTVVGIVTVIARIGRWRLTGVLAILAPVIEAVAVLALLLYGLSTI